MELGHMLKALGEPMRLKIYQALLERKHCVRSLSKKFGISESAISQHMKVMKDAGLVYGEKYGYRDALHQHLRMELLLYQSDADCRSCESDGLYSEWCT